MALLTAASALGLPTLVASFAILGRTRFYKDKYTLEKREVQLLKAERSRLQADVDALELQLPHRLLEKAEASERSGASEDAQRLLEVALDNVSRPAAEICRMLAHTHLEHGDVQEAERLRSAALLLAPNPSADDALAEEAREVAVFVSKETGDYDPLDDASKPLTPPLRSNTADAATLVSGLADRAEKLLLNSSDKRDWEEAERLAYRAREEAGRAGLTRETPGLKAWRVHARTLSFTGRADKAAKEFDDLLQVESAVRPPADKELLLTRELRALAYSYTGDFAEAEREFATILPLLEKSYGPRAQVVRNVRTSRAMFLTDRLGRHDEAIVEIDRLIEDFASVDSCGTSILNVVKATAYLRLGRSEDKDRLKRSFTDEMTSLWNSRLRSLGLSE